MIIKSRLGCEPWNFDVWPWKIGKEPLNWGIVIPKRRVLWTFSECHNPDPICICICIGIHVCIYIYIFRGALKSMPERGVHHWVWHITMLKGNLPLLGHARASIFNATSGSTVWSENIHQKTKLCSGKCSSGGRKFFPFSTLLISSSSAADKLSSFRVACVADRISSRNKLKFF